MDKKKTYQIRVPEELLEKFQQVAKKHDRSPAAEIREFMRWYVDEFEMIKVSPWERRVPF